MLKLLFVAVFLGCTSTDQASLWFLWFYVQEHPKAQPAVVLVLKRLRRRGNDLKSHPTDWEKPGIEPATPGLQDIGLSSTPRRLLRTGAEPLLSLLWCSSWFIIELFIPRHFKSAGYYVIPSIRKIAFECPSVFPSVLHRFHSAESIFNRFSSNLLWELILGRCVLGLQIGKLWQISTELRPLIDVRNWFSLTIFGISSPIFYESRYCEGVFWECRWVNFDK